MAKYWRKRLNLFGLCCLVGGCGLLDYPELGIEDNDVACHDGQDNDLDGATDCEDAACREFCDETTLAACHDGVDNDQNRKRDCSDPACAKHCPEADAATCSDGQDNDFDGDVDCEDASCDGFCPEETPADCNDKRDNDGDGLSDGADPRCWLLSPPRAQRCAVTHGAEIIETFEADELTTDRAFDRWGSHGTFPFEVGPSVDPRDSYHQLNDGRLVWPASRIDFNSSDGRQDRFLAFTYNTTASRTLDQNMGALVHQWAFSGSWQDFELSFSADVTPTTLLRAGIVPADLAPISKPPLVGAESALLALTLDAARGAPTWSMTVEGAHVEAPLPVTALSCDGLLCDLAFSKVRVVLEDSGFHATLTRPDGEVSELFGPPPGSLSMAAARLVFWGGSTELSASAGLDDLHLRVLGEAPCDDVAPQIPSSDCSLARELKAFGHVVSLASTGEGETCALIGASASAQDPDPETVTAWRSATGESWQSVSSSDEPALELPEGAGLVGAAIAHDDAGWQVAVAYREGADVRLGTAGSERCGTWGTLRPGPLLFPDAEPPSYIIEGGARHAYFTRPPTEEVSRTLWRVALDDQATPELLAELPPQVASPVSVGRVGNQDLVLIHPVATGRAAIGIGVLIGESAGRSWRAVEPATLLETPPALHNFSDSLSFDEQGVVSAALSWSDRGGYLLYGAASSKGILDHLRANRIVSVGTARLFAPGLDVAPTSPRVASRCGDGRCDAGESCQLCPADCECAGRLLLSDVFNTKQPWQMVSVDPVPASVAYLDLERDALNWGGGATTWFVLPLERSIIADFELSFDFNGPFLGGPCNAYVGLGTLINSGISSGVFARLSYGSCEGQYIVEPFVKADATEFAPTDTDNDCVNEAHWKVGAPRRISLSRRGNQVSVVLERELGCGVVENTVDYSGALSELPELLVGVGAFRPTGGYFGCGAASLSNLRLRLLEDPDDCPVALATCQVGSQQASCVDTERSVEHCGGCGQSCSLHEVCEGGSCVCVGAPGVERCDGACIDSLTSLEHCGACDQPCFWRCSGGVCQVAGTCEDPRPLPPEGGVFLVDLHEQAPDASNLCEEELGGAYLEHELVLSFTPTTSGLTRLMVDVEEGPVFPVLGITTDLTCEMPVLACMIDDEEFGGVPIEIQVAAGTTYLIRVAIDADRSFGSRVVLRVEAP